MGESVGELVGRAGIETLALSALEDRTVAGVLLVGDAGTGKTALGEQLLRRCEASGRPVWRIYAGTLPPYDLPFTAAAAHLPADLVSSGIAPAVALKQFLAARGDTTVALVDDAEAIDAATAGALANAAEHGLVQLVVTARSGHSLPDPIGRLTGARELLRIECGPLDPRDTVALAEATLGVEFTPDTQRRLWSLTEGNPLSIRELVLAADEAGRLKREGAAWSIDSVPGDATRLVDLIADRLSALPPEDVEALIVIAVAEPVGPAVIEEHVALDVVERLRAQGWLRMTSSDRRVQIGLAHPLYGEILRATQSPIALRRTRASIAASVAAAGGRRRADRLRLATWSLDGDVEVDVATLIDAASSSFASGDHVLAERLARAAFDREPSFVSGRALEGPLYELGDAEELEAFFERWAVWAVDDEQRKVFESCLASARYWRGADGSAVDALASRSTDPPDELDRHELSAQAASLYVTRGDIERAIELGEPLLRSGSPRAQIHATLAAAHGYRANGRPERAVALVDAVVAAYRAVGPEAYVVSYNALSNITVHALAEAGRFDAADAAGRESLDAAHDAGSASTVGLAHLAVGWSRVLRGLDADDHLDQAFRWFVQGRHPGMARWALAARGLGRVGRNDIDGAREMRAELDRLGEHPARIFESVVDRIDAWIAYGDGDLQTAARLLTASAAAARSLGNVTGELGCWHDLARLGQPADSLDRVREIRDAGVEGAFLPAQIDHVEALASGDVAVLSGSVERLDALGLANFAAESARAAARVCASNGDSRRAAHWLRRSEELLASAGIPTVDPVTRLAELQLSAREREVALLAARGVANRDIAERLSISVRTVGNHLTNVYNKLQVGGRAELAELVGTSLGASGRSTPAN